MPKGPSRRKRRLRRAGIGVVLGLVLMIALAEWWLYPTMLSYGGHRAEVMAMETVSETAAAVIGETQTAYGTLVSVERDSEGNIVTLASDAMQLNLLQSRITERLLSELEQRGRSGFSVPFGTIFGGAFLSGRGPDIEFHVALDGVAKTALRDEFSAAGINQTYHRVYLDVQLRVLLTTMGHREIREVSMSVVMAQTVLMGTVPNTYVNWNR